MYTEIRRQKLIFSETDKRDMQEAADAISAIATVGGAWLMRVLTNRHDRTNETPLTLPLDWKEG